MGNERGVTLIELIIAMAMVSILSVSSIANTMSQSRVFERSAEKLFVDIQYCKSMTTQTDAKYSLYFTDRGYRVERINYKGETIGVETIELADSLKWGKRPESIRFSGINGLLLVGQGSERIVQVVEKKSKRVKEITIVPISNRVAIREI